MNPMSITFAQYLKQLPSEKLYEQFRDQLALERRVISSTVIDSIVDLVSNGDAIRDRVQQLSEPALRLAVAVYASGTRPVEISFDRDEAAELVDSFLAGPCRTPDGKTWLCSFSDMAESIHSELVSRAKVVVPSSFRSTPFAVTMCQSIPDLVVVLALAEKGEILRTRTDKLGKGTCRRLRKLLTVAHTPWRKDIAELVALFFSYARSRLFFVESSGAFQLTSNFAAAVQKPRTDVLADFVSFCSQGECWWDWDAFGAALGSTWVALSFFPEFMRSRVSQALMVGAACGKVAVHTDGDECWFWIPGSEQVPKLEPGAITVLPDYSAVLAPGVSLAELYLYARMGDLESFDHVYRGALSRESLGHALSRGLEPDTAFAALHRWLAPSNVIETVREWVREFNRTAITSGPLVLVGDPKVVPHLDSFAPLRELLIPVNVAALYRIRPGCKRQVVEQLQTLGFDTRFPEDVVEPGEAEPVPTPGQTTARFELIRELDELRPAAVREPKGGKYGTEMQERSPDELDNVIDYAVLMGLGVRFDYAGSPGIRRGLYRTQPLGRNRGGEPGFEARDIKTGTHKRFLLGRIQRIGVMAL